MQTQMQTSQATLRLLNSQRYQNFKVAQLKVAVKSDPNHANQQILWIRVTFGGLTLFWTGFLHAPIMDHSKSPPPPPPPPSLPLPVGT